MKRDGASQESDSDYSPEEINSKSRDRVFARALRILAARPRSERQLRDRLLAVADGPLIDQCISRLKELGLINDKSFAESYATYRVTTKPMGRTRLARELAGKRVDRDAIREALESVFDATNEEALIDRAIEKRIRTRGRPKDRRASKNLFDHLMRLGFGYDLILKKIRSIGDFDGD